MCCAWPGASKSQRAIITISKDAQIDAGGISILAPVGTAILGYAKGDVVVDHCHMKIHINKELRSNNIAEEVSQVSGCAQENPRSTRCRRACRPRAVSFRQRRTHQPLLHSDGVCPRPGQRRSTGQKTESIAPSAAIPRTADDPAPAPHQTPPSKAKNHLTAS